MEPKALALSVSAAGLLCGVAGLLRGRPREGTAMMLELWTAAGLLRLTGTPDWRATVAAAALIAVRILVRRQLLRGALAAGRRPIPARTNRADRDKAPPRPPA